jgi:hypothetical protein
MRVKMLEDRTVTVDGVNQVDCHAGDYHTMGDGVAASLIAAGAAEPAEPQAGQDAAPSDANAEAEKADEQPLENAAAEKADEQPLENKDSDAAKPAAKPRRRKKQS